jgi:hypothetical protein
MLKYARGVIPVVDAGSATLAVVSPEKTKSNPLGAGRNPRAGEAAAPFTLKLTAKEKATYQAAAELEKLSLASWIRAACEARLPKRKKRGGS